jgi:peroxiredoxin
MSLKLTPRVALLLIAGLFFLPLAIAWMMHSGAIDYRPGSTRNFGELVKPPQPIAWSGVSFDQDAASSGESPFSGHWLVLHAVPNPCAEACLADATDLRQVHRATGRDQSRIRLGLLHDLQDPAAALRLQDIYSAFHLVEDPDGRLWTMLDGLADQGAAPGASRGATFLVDPLGNIIMIYAAGSDPNGLKRDLKRLLTWTKLDEHK